MVNVPEEKRKPRKLNKDEIADILSNRREDIDAKLLKSYFANKENSPAKYYPSDKFTLPKGKLYNDEPIQTTVGRYIFNLFCVSDKILAIIGYQNITMNKKGINSLNNKISNLLLKDKLTTLEVHDYIDRMQWLGFRISRFINSSLTYNLLIPNENIEKKKEELKKKYEKEIVNKDIAGITKMEKELIDYAKTQVENIPDIEIYDSGGRGSFNNNYKNTSLMRGAMKSYGDETEVTISTNSLVDGIPPEEMPAYADMITAASASRSLNTREGGYEAKKMNTAFQDIKLDEAGSDCGTKLTIPMEITNENKNLFTYRYIVENNKLILLDDENIGNYIGKYVNLRSPMKCKGKNICNKCAGELYYNIGNSENIGLLFQKESTSIQNLAMKHFHDMTIQTIDIEPEDYIKPID